jgi:hypothetical protein
MRKGIKRVQLQKSRLPRRRYREDIPDDCRDCSFWLKGIDNCSRYDCFYLIEEERQMTAEGDRPDSDCRACPYGRERPCVGYCIKELHRENARQFADQKGR